MENSKMKQLILVVGFLMFFMASLTTEAGALPFNTRPVTPGDNDLQDFFNSNITGSTYNAIGDQSSAAIFTATGTASVTSFAFSALGGGSYSSDDKFGIYSFSSGMLIPIFDLSKITADSIPAATVSFYTNGTVQVLGAGSSVINATYSGFGADVFGYYTYVGGSTHYTEDDKNGDEAWALTYQGHGGTLEMPGILSPITFDSNHWLFAFETIMDTGETHKDFDDLIVAAESVTPIPEPATIMLLGAGLVGLGGWARKGKKSAKKA